jgi:D-alanine-D-alanine ligase
VITLDRLRIAVLFGGRSGEHEVSLRSAASIMAGLKEQEGFEVLPVGITREGSWIYGDDPLQALSTGDVPGRNVRVTVLPDPAERGLYVLEGENKGSTIAVDVVFPVLHGTFGEDGTVQGLLELARLPYVGAGVLGSAVGMDKILMKAVLEQGGMPVGEYIWFKSVDWERESGRISEEIKDKLGYPCFVKPANMGSSVGISKVSEEESLEEAISLAARFDRKILVEKHLAGREIECSVLGNDQPQASVAGEIVPCNEFYDYRAKYIDDRSTIHIPAALPEELSLKVRELAVKTYVLLDCAGLARVDFFVDDKSGKVWVNEINTIPGFTSISMYPKMWEASGLPFNKLLSELVELALSRFAEKERLETVYQP